MKIELSATIYAKSISKLSKRAIKQLASLFKQFESDWISAHKNNTSIPIQSTTKKNFRATLAIFPTINPISLTPKDHHKIATLAQKHASKKFTTDASKVQQQFEQANYQKKLEALAKRPRTHNCIIQKAKRPTKNNPPHITTNK